MDRRDEFAELVPDKDVETLRRASLPWPAPEPLLLKFVADHLCGGPTTATSILITACRQMLSEIFATGQSSWSPVRPVVGDEAWHYLGDRLGLDGQATPPLAALVAARA